tara:strand:+ start:106 stop:432 length:327 start_codon:yes stop_codon:yes gene_type:complete
MIANERHEEYMKRQLKSTLPTDAKERKAIPVYTGFIKYFPDAIVEISKISLKGGIQHGQTPETLHWDRSKSGDELDAMMRHLIDEDWAQVAWRALANLQKQIERSRGA